jgi:hypothetical protein
VSAATLYPAIDRGGPSSGPMTDLATNGDESGNATYAPPLVFEDTWPSAEAASSPG